MKKNRLLLMCILFIATAAIGQTPMYFNQNNAGGANAFPFSSLATNKVQWCIPANSLGTVGPGNNITVVYFQSGSNANQTYPNLNIRLKTGTSAGLVGTGNLFETGMTTVFAGVNVPVSSTTGSWFSFTLTTPFLYDPNLPLLIEVEQNATSGSGPTVYQQAFPGPGNGRQYGGYGQTNFTGSGAQLVNFGIDVLPATPCTAPPAANFVVPASFTTCPGINNPPLGIASSYSFGGITYQWQSSTQSSVGLWTSIPGATNNTAPTPTIGITTWFQVVATCTNPGGGSTTLTPTQFSVAGSVQDVAPYFEDFEGILIDDRLPNCSWYAPTLGTSARTYTAAAANNRLPRSGTKFATFANNPAGTNYYYTNEIWLEPGITYSAAMWYQTDLAGSANWSNLAILLGTSQTPTGLVPIASVNGAAISPVYKSLSDTFAVSTAAYYYIAVRVTGAGGGAPYLSWDDLSITIPCSAGANSPNLVVSPATATVCEGSALTVNATGAPVVTWSNGDNGLTVTDFPNVSGNLVATGLNPLTGCTSTAAVKISVNPSPIVQLFAVPAQVCLGKPVTLMANGANSYAWSNGGVGPVITTIPTGNTTYSVIGTGTNNCMGFNSVAVTVLPLPNIVAGGAGQTVCKGDPLMLSASGGSSYRWVSDISSLVLSGSPITVVPMVSGTYTVTGTNNAGCENKAMAAVVVDLCTGLNERAYTGEIRVFPNPSSGIFTIESAEKVNTIVITDLTGRVVYQKEMQGRSGSFDIGHLAAGVYYVKLGLEHSSETFRVIRN